MDTLFPTTIINYIGAFASAFTANNFIYFRGFMLGFMLLGETRKCVTNIARTCFFVSRHVSSWERFLSQYQWDITEVRQRLVKLLKERLQDKLLVYGAYLAWVDTTLVAKVKGNMPGVQKWHDHSGNPDRGEHLIGHHWSLVGLLGATFIAREWTPMCFPILTNLISGNTNPIGFVVDANGVAGAMNFWDAVCPLIAQLSGMLNGPLEHQPMRVVADAYFAKAPFINWMLGISVHVITRMRKDAVGWDDPEPEPPLPPDKKRLGRPRTKPRKGKKWKLVDLVEIFPAECVTVFIYGKLRTFRVVTRDVWVRDVIQKVRVVVIQAKGEHIILLSTDLTLTARQIITLYSMRFAAELGIRDAKQHFGFGDYQCTSLIAMTRFVGLSLISLCLWRLTILTDIAAEWLQVQDKTSPFSFTRIRRATMGFVIRQIFRNSACGADFQKSGEVPEEIFRLVA
jgi:hypothetical protein